MKNLEKLRRCPVCGSGRLYPSRRRGVSEFMLELIGADIQRCHACRARMFWFGLTAIRLGEDARDGFLASGAVICLGSLLCIAVMLWMLRRLSGTD